MDARNTYNELLKANRCNGETFDVPASMLQGEVTADDLGIMEFFPFDNNGGDESSAFDELHDLDADHDQLAASGHLPEDEYSISELTHQFLEDTSRWKGKGVQQHSNSVTEVTPEDESLLGVLSHVMRLEKMAKRPTFSSEGGETEEPAHKRVRLNEMDDAGMDIEQIVREVPISGTRQNELSLDEKRNLISEIEISFGLDQNAEQRRAFWIVADHFVAERTAQMLMLLTGVGGSGKSHVINTIMSLFNRCDAGGQIFLSASTGAAAVLIDGYTIHALTYLPGDEKLSDMKDAQLKQLWANIRYLVIDEVSMVSAELLNSISKRIKDAKPGEDGRSSEIPFGGVNVIFVGDLGQLRPVRGSALYAWSLTDRIIPSTKESNKGQIGFFGASLWKQLTHVVELKKNIRAVTDPDFINLLARIRSGVPQLPADNSTVQARLMERLAVTNREQYLRLCRAPVVFGEKRLRDCYNEIRTREFAMQTGQEFTIYLCADRINRLPVTGALRHHLSQLSSTLTKDAMGRLPLVPGMPVMVTENLSISHKVVNGTQGTLRDVIYRSSPEGKEIVCAYVEIPSSTFALEGLEQSVVPILPRSSYFQYTHPSSGTKVSISRQQVPLLPAWAFTDYKVQGASMKSVVVDLASARGLQHAYVMLSRAHSLNDVGILRPFHPQRVFTRIQGDLRAGLHRISGLDDNTRVWFETANTL